MYNPSIPVSTGTLRDPLGPSGPTGTLLTPWSPFGPHERIPISPSSAQPSVENARWSLHNIVSNFLPKPTFKNLTQHNGHTVPATVKHHPRERSRLPNNTKDKYTARKKKLISPVFISKRAIDCNLTALF